MGSGFSIDFIFRDTNRLTGAMEERLVEACDIVRDVTGHAEGRRQPVAHDLAEATPY